jgi:pyruvate, orthophosphate dikinase
VLPEHLDQLLHPRFPDVEMKEYKDAVMTRGLPASPGAAVGQIAMTNEQVVENKEKGIPSIMVRDETSPDDVAGMFAAEGILTARGGMTSHAAVVARGRNALPSVVVVFCDYLFGLYGILSLLSFSSQHRLG